MTTVVVDDLEHLELQFTWDEVPGTTNPALANWFFLVRIQEGPSTGTCADGLPAPCWDVFSQLRHITDPHPELGESGGGDLVQVSLTFSKMSFGIGQRAFVAPHGSEFDLYEAFCERTTPPPFLTATIIGTYVVPEPATLILLGTGCLCWPCRYGRRLLHARSWRRL